MDVLHDSDALEQTVVFRRLLVPRLAGLAVAALIIGTLVPGFSMAARVGSVALFLLPLLLVAALELRLRHRLAGDLGARKS